MEGTAGLPPTVTLALALIMTGVPGLSAVAVAFIGRGGKAVQPEPVSPPSIDLTADLDSINDRLSRENERLDREAQRCQDSERLAQVEVQRLRAYVIALGGTP